MLVTVYVRHSKKCPKSKERNSGQYKRCNCPKWLRWGKADKQSAKTRSWEIATKKARQLEQELELKALGLQPPKKVEPISIEAATNLYLADMVQRGKGTDKPKRMLLRFQNYAHGKGIMLLQDVTARLLTEWRSTWTFKVNSSSPAVHWAVAKTFFGWAFSTDLIATDPTAKMKSLPYVHNQVFPLSQEEMARILDATYQCGFSPDLAFRVKTFILLQRWSGLACMDAATLARDRLSANDNLNRVHRNKTGTGVFIPLPPTVAGRPDYRFYRRDGKSGVS